MQAKLPNVNFKPNAQRPQALDPQPSSKAQACILGGSGTLVTSCFIIDLSVSLPQLGSLSGYLEVYLYYLLTKSPDPPSTPLPRAPGRAWQHQCYAKLTESYPKAPCTHIVYALALK